MKLTKNQTNILYNLYKDKTWAFNKPKAHKKTIESLYKNNLIIVVLYADGLHWELSNKGLEILI